MPETVTFDHYEVLTRDDGSMYELGRGAMGITYKAFDTNLRVPVALKVINCSNLNTDIARQRFVREARSAAKLRHRNVASVFHLGADGDTYFYAMEFIDGETVEALIKRQGALPPLLALRITLQVTRALNAATQCGLVHRDIKPSNLMLVREDEELVVKVIDFGLAKTCVPGEGDEDAATLSLGGFVGTPHFASPEQLEDNEIDVRSDIYSLGVTLWFMLAGHTPFAGSMAQVMSQHLTKPPPFEKLQNPPPAVAALLRKMLAKDPAARHQTPAELRQDIEKCIESVAGAPAAVSMAMAADDETYATIAEESEFTVQPTQFEAGTLVAGRYEIKQALGETNAGRIFQAYDQDQKVDVRLLVLLREFTEDPTLYTQLEREVSRIVPVQHTNLLRIFGLETVVPTSFVVIEWTEGFTLLELLRARRELAIEETLLLLKQACAGVDFAISAGLKRLDLGLHQVFVDFGPTPEGKDHWLRRPVTEWPKFRLKLNPLGITRELSASETWAGGQTVVSGSTGTHGAHGDTRGMYISGLAEITYELLGGALSPLGLASGAAIRYTPLATLTEEGNEVVKRAIAPTNAFPTAEAFQGELDTAERKNIDFGSKKYETRATTTVPPPRPTPAPPATPPPTAARASAAPVRRRRFPVGFIGGIATVATIATLVYVFLRDSTPEQLPDARVKATPVAASPSPRAATPRLADATPAIPKVTPAPTPLRDDAMRAAVASAQVLENDGDPVRSIRAWLRVLKQFPETESGKVRLEMLLEGMLEKMQKEPEKLPDSNFAEIRELLEEAAHLDIMAAQMLLGMNLKKSEPVNAFNWFSAAAAQGNAAAYMQMGMMFSTGQGTELNLQKAIECFEVAAEKGFANAQVAMGDAYLRGIGVPKDPAKALVYLRKAADQKHPHGMSLLGTSYHRGIGTKPNFEEARRLFGDAADLGFAEAMGNLGVLYFNGDGVDKDEKKAVSLFEKGAKAGDLNSMYLLALCHESGQGVPREDRLTAQRWMKEAAEGGHPKAQEWCKKGNVPFKAPSSTRG